MHILLLPSWYSTPEIPWNGAFVEQQAIALALAGVRVGAAMVEQRSLRLLSPRRLAESHFQISCSVDRGVSTLRMKGWNTLGQTRLGAKVWSALSQRLVEAYVDRFGVPDVLHAHSALYAGKVAERMAAELSRPYVVTEHSSLILKDALSSKARQEAGRIYRNAARVLAVSGPLLKAVASVAGTQLGEVVPNTADLDFFTVPRLPRQRDPFTFLSVGNLVPGKRIDRLIRAFAEVWQVRQNARLVIVGSGTETCALHALARHCGVASAIEFTGGVTKQAVREQMWHANVLVHPSASETFGVVLIEALATGIPVIATRCGGPEEIVEDGIGVLVDVDDQVALVTSMTTAIERQYSEHALRAHVLARFSFDSVAQKLLAIYAQVSESRPSSIRAEMIVGAGR